MSGYLETSYAYGLELLDKPSLLFQLPLTLQIPLSILVVLTLRRGIKLLYSLFWKPFDNYSDFTGYSQYSTSNSDVQNGDLARKETINEFQQRRKAGDVPPVYPNGWYSILESNKLRIRKVEEVNALGLNLVAWRGERGVAYVADAYCPHLGAHLGVGGTVNEECIVCPFHGWEFEGPSGKVAKLPYASSSKALESEKIKMRRIFEMNGFIYLWFHAEDEDPSWFPDFIPDVQRRQLVYRGRYEFRVACHVQELPENGADAIHFGYFHKLPILSGNPFFSFSSTRDDLSGQWKSCDEEGRKHVANLHVAHDLKMFNIVSLGEVYIKATQVGPACNHVELNTPLGKIIVIQTITPCEPLIQKVTQHVYTSSSFIRPLAKLIMLAQKAMVSRDVLTWSRRNKKHPPQSKEDAALKRFRLWYNQFYSENSSKQYFSKNNANDGSLF